MREGWRETTLGEVATRRKDFTPVVADTLYRVVGVQRSGWGLVDRGPVRGDSMKFDKLLELHTDDLVYRTITAFEAPSAVVSIKFEGAFVTPQTFPTYVIDRSQLLPGYMALLTTSPDFHAAMSTRCVGSVLRRKTLSQGAFESIPINLPPLDEQRRIVDLIAAVDDAVEAAEAEGYALEAQLGLLRTDLLGRYEDVRVSELIEKIEGGRSVQAEGRPPRPGEIGVIKLSAVNERGFLASESKTLASAEGFTDRMLIRPGDVLVTRANTSERVGMTCLVDTVPDGLYLSDKTLRIVPKTGVEAETLVHALQSPRVRAQFSAFGTGTSASMQNISQKDIGRARTGWPRDARDQIHVGRTLSAHAACAAAARETADALRTLRSNLLTVLLSGDHEIPASYDVLLEGDVL